MKSARRISSIIVFAALMAELWVAARHSSLATSLGTLFPRTFASFVLLLAPLWFFGFGFAEPLKFLSARTKILAAALLSLPYFVLHLGISDFNWRPDLIMIAFPVLLAAFLHSPANPQKLTWRDVAALSIIVAAYFLKWLYAAWPAPEMALFSKLFLADVAIYCFVVIRGLEGMGYSLVPTASSFLIGIREWVFYFPIALILGEATGFIRFHRALPALHTWVPDVLLTFLLVAIPEELFFRGILQNLLETRLGRTGALLTAAGLFGLSHFNHGSIFNWRYVLLASIAGIFYGRAWRDRRQIFASVLTHTLVDVVWSLWFR